MFVFESDASSQWTAHNEGSLQLSFQILIWLPIMAATCSHEMVRQTSNFSNSASYVIDL